MKLTDHFERVVIINLPYKEDRRQRLERHLEDLCIADPAKLTWMRAISGEMCPPPAYFQAGGGAWGCLQSHLRIAQDATMDKLENYLVLEDDVIFHERSAEHLARLLGEVPNDWAQLYLGGQHLLDPEAVEGSPFVFRCRNINRTHAFALRKNVFKAFQQHIAHAPDFIARGEGWHIDHQLGIAHERNDWNAYCPAWWIAGQEEGMSNISGRATPTYWWHHGGFSNGLPFIHVGDVPDHHWDQLKRHIHFGNYLKKGTLQDVGLDSCMGSPGNLQSWLKMIARESITHWKLPGIQHPGIPLEEVAQNWGARVIPLQEADLRSLNDYPTNSLFPHPLNSKVECFGNIPRRTSAA